MKPAERIIDLYRIAGLPFCQPEAHGAIRHGANQETQHILIIPGGNVGKFSKEGIGWNLRNSVDIAHPSSLKTSFPTLLRKSWDQH